MERRGFLGALAAASLGVALDGALAETARAQTTPQDAASSPGRAAKRSDFPANSIIVLVHAAWADGYCWSNIVVPLERHGLKVMCAPIPLTALTDDIAALSHALERASGPLVLVGHAYSGAVIAAVKEERVKSLVYISALAPDEGETVEKIFYREAPSPEAPKMVPIPTVLYGCPTTPFTRRSRRRHRPNRPRSRPLCSGRFRFSASSSPRRRRFGDQNHRGTWLLKKTA